MQRGCPSNISIQDQKLDCHGDLRQKRFGNPGIATNYGKPWDGVHMRGRLAGRHYTNSILRIFAAHFSQLDLESSASQSRDRYHETCPQTEHMRSHFDSSHHNLHNVKQGFSQQQTFGRNRGFKKNNERQYSGYEQSYFNIPVSNMFQGNF